MARKSIYTFEYQLLAHRLRRARERAGLTQVEVARALGRPQSFVSKAETAERRLDVFELVEFLDLYRVPVGRALSSRLTAEERALKADLDGRRLALASRGRGRRP